MNGVRAQVSLSQIRTANETYIFSVGCKTALDTLNAAYVLKNAQLEQTKGIVKMQELDLEICKEVIAGLNLENEANKKQLKKEIRRKKFNAVLLYCVTGVAVVTTALLLVR